jgi:ArsR family transcriptional regulator, virulence genes transcriptional regulator
MEINNDQAPLQLNAINLKKAALIIRAVNHKLRIAIIKLLHEEGRMSVTDIYIKLRLEQSVASQHLSILRIAGVVITTRDGKNIYYTLDGSRLDTLMGLVDDIVKA